MSTPSIPQSPLHQDPVHGKVVAITGASSGIGEATALHLAAHGARLLLGARRRERLDALVARIREQGGEAVAQTVDVTRRDQVEAFVGAAVAHFGRLDVMVGNAGVMPLSPLDAGRVDEWDRMIDVNIKGVLYGIAAALPVMRSQRSGHFVNLSSVAGQVVFPGGAVYCGTKFAVNAISEGLRQEAGADIRVTTIAPGATASELFDSITDATTREHLDATLPEPIPAAAIARAIAFAIGQPADVDVNQIVVRPTAQLL
ncbi:SDR family NAD(P)-dependent oxidoreductase [Lysobacter maris]|uniref:SDR family NAD(P)-dependent oxidoreductase n=2 Tax=Marilutibacter maris TaxID=1605891 RepID=A0A508B718_9GAMM|nr:SDR family oxidoreductase [Lysobacter maris]KAB8198782.1 SDR family NAD(P)-dependent oxidoreductase [Lysobacter maris]